MRSALAEYRERLAERQATTARLSAVSDRFSNVRLLIFVAFVVLIWAVAGAPKLHGGVLLVPVVAFIVLVVLHEKLVRRRSLSLRSERFYERGVERLTGEWQGKGRDGHRYESASHPYAGDLDLFGPGSLFELLNGARTRAGEDLLAGWITEPGEIEELRERQAAVDELRPRLDLREEMRLLEDDVQVEIHRQALADWGTAPALLTSRLIPIVAVILGLAGLAAAVGWFFAWFGPGPLALAVLLNLGVRGLHRGRLGAVMGGVEKPATELLLMSAILARIEAEPVESPHLVRLREALTTAGAPPSRRIASLVRRLQILDSARNPLFAPIALLVFWDLLSLYSIDRWRQVSGAAVEAWVVAAAEFEALLSLASHAWEHPDDPFPELTDEGPTFAATSIGHPLLPEETAVSNDIALDETLSLLVVTGSNMSGKSTFLRTIGTNTVLALAGAPVRAASLKVSRLQVAASIRIVNSLMEGASKFYAEIKRLKQVTDLAKKGEPTALFLLDELLHGTNSEDRAAGAGAVVRTLVAAGSIGLVTSHDLAVAKIADSLGATAKNVHFEDRVVEDEIVFDYQLRPGVVTKGNALALMRAVGLDVDEAPAES